MRVAIYVQHLLGTGHLVRMQLLAGALHQAGHNVLLLSGGKLGTELPYPAVQLPVLKTRPGDFLTLLDESGAAVSDDWKQWRKNSLLLEVDKFRPDVMVIETWPFGRRQLAWEILPLVQQLRASQPRPMIVSSIRDVLQKREEKRRKETLDHIAQFIDLVMVHGGETLTPLSASFEPAEMITCPVRYSGYIGKAELSSAVTKDTHDGKDEVIVSAGGGATGNALLTVAAEAAAQDHRVWRLLVGPNIDRQTRVSLPLRSSDRIIIENNRSDFHALLRHCTVSVSQFGYNTAIDLLSAKCHAVVVPYAEDGETEQTQRALCFADQGVVTLLHENALTPSSLLTAIANALMQKNSGVMTLDVAGASQSVQILQSRFTQFRS